MIELAHRISVHLTWLFVATVAALSIWETIAPRRALRLSTARRWFFHLLLFLVPAVAVRLLGVAPVALAIVRSRDGGGVLSRPEIPWTASFVAALLVLDLARYL